MIRLASSSAVSTVHLLVAIGCSQARTSRSSQRLPTPNDREEIRRDRCPECQRLTVVFVPEHTRSDDGWQTVLDLTARGLVRLRDRRRSQSPQYDAVSALASACRLTAVGGPLHAVAPGRAFLRDATGLDQAGGLAEVR